MSDYSGVNDSRSVAGIVAEIRDEISSFLHTRMEMLQAELREARAALKAAIPLATIAIGFLATGYLLITAALVSLVVVAFGNDPYRWFYAFLIIGGLWTVGGAIFAYLASSALRTHSIYPKRTLQILKADKNWLQSEARGNV